MVVDKATRRTFRKTLEDKLRVAASNNQGLIVSWELSRSFDRVAIVCHEATFRARVIDHLATSLTRLLGVGKRLDLVERDLRALEVECFPEAGGDALLRRVYNVE